MKFLFLSFLFLALPVSAKEQIRVLMVVNEGFQPSEYFEPRSTFENEGYDIKVATRFGKAVRPGQKYPDVPEVEAQYSFSQIRVQDFDVITFTGGGGAWSDYFPDRTLHQVLRSAMNDEKVIVGLICAATGLLATASNLDGETPQYQGRRVTGYADVEGLLKKVGKLDFIQGDPSSPFVVVDQRLVTGRDPQSSKLFGRKIVEFLR